MLSHPGRKRNPGFRRRGLCTLNAGTTIVRSDMGNRLRIVEAIWVGYVFNVYQPGGYWYDVGGVYIFAGQNSMGQWVALYVGETQSFARRLASHERWPEAQRLGATHIHARREDSTWQRQVLEQTLIRTFQPRLNVQYQR